MITLLFDKFINDAFFHTFDFLSTCASHGIVLNADKFVFCQEEINFAGFRITNTGIKPSEATLRALKDFPTPTSTTDVRSWFGLVRQVAYAHSVSDDLAPLRDLLMHDDGKKPRFKWNEHLQHAFEKSKTHVVESVARGIETFEPERHTCLQCDWSKNGIGFLLLQKHCKCIAPHPLEPMLKPCCESGWKTVFAGSRFTNAAESRYAPTEGEALSVVWALKTSRMFTLGCPNLTVVTDHKPLLGIFNGRDVASINNSRIRRLKEHTLEYNFQIKYCPGKFHIGADALSRNPVHSTPITDDISQICEIAMLATVTSVVESISTISCIDGDTTPSIVTLEKVELECVKDADYMELRDLVISGFPESRRAVPDHAKVYWPLAQKGLLHTFNSIILYQDRIIIPKSLRTYIIQVLHSAHQGCTGMLARASRSVYWPGIRKSIMSFQTNCRSCSEISPSQPREPLQLTPLAKRPFQIICSDLFQLNGRFYLIVVDRFSGFLHIFYSRTPPTHKFLIKHIRDIFVRYGRPDQLDTDGGPQYQSAAFLHFLATWGVKHRISSPYYAQSNGRAELGVKTAKRLLRSNTAPDGSLDNNNVAQAILQYHNTPLQDAPMSPSELLFGRELADFLPVNPKAYKLHPYWDNQVEQSNRQRSIRHKRLIQRYNIGTRELKPLSVGQHVIIQNLITKRWDRFGTVLQVLPYRKYKLRMHGTGNVTCRNRRFLKPKRGQFAGLSSGPIVVSNQHTPNYIPLGSTTPSGRVEEEIRSTPLLQDHREVPPIQSPSTTLLQQEHTFQSPPSLPVATEEQGPSHNTVKEALASRRLRPFNKPGLKE